MKEVALPLVNGKYKAEFPDKCVYCGAPRALTLRQTASAGSSRRKRFVTVDVPFCAAHARESRHNARLLTSILIVLSLVSCGLLFGITTSINRNPATGLLVFLGLVAVGLAFAGRELLRKRLVRTHETMGDMPRGGLLGFKVRLAGDQVQFSFVNGRMADEFAQLNQPRPPKAEKHEYPS